jgi:glycosyltransferase involved in cell wall biosynthesis
LYRALSRLHQQTPIDIAEFNDFFGGAYYALSAKACGLDFATCLIGVRLHNTWTALVKAGDAEVLEPHSLHLRAIEQASLRLAEFQLTASVEYAEKMLMPVHGAGLGPWVVSRPAVTQWPHPIHPSDDDPGKAVMFYGRLQPFKGLDRFLAAALAFADQHLDMEVWLVGSDSHLVRDPRYKSFQAELQARIPHRLQARFRFWGRLSFEQLEALLPQVRFAVFPNYFESFCYAAHELRRAGVPLIVPDSPAFVAYFQHEHNALVFDGSIDSLISAMGRMSEDHGLRLRLINLEQDGPRDELGSFYAHKSTGWMTAGLRVEHPLTVVVLCENEETMHPASLLALRAQLRPGDQLIQLCRRQQDLSQPGLLFLGQLWYARTAEGRPLSPEQARTTKAIVILDAADEVEEGALTALCRAGERNDQIAFVAGWLRLKDGRAADQLVPFASAVDTTELLFSPYGMRPRAWMRTPHGLRLDDLFDLRLGRLGEIGYLWQLEDHGRVGVTVPHVLFRVPDPLGKATPAGSFAAASAYLVTCNETPFRQRALSWRALMLEEKRPTPMHTQVLHGVDVIARDPRRGARALLRRVLKLVQGLVR